MLFKTRDKQVGKTLYRSRPLLIPPQQAYAPPEQGAAWFATTTTVWRVDELIRRRVRDWKRLLGEDGHTGARAEVFRKDHDSVYTATHSVFPAPLVEWILLRYGGPKRGRILDAFAGGPPRGIVSSIMDFVYVGFEVRQEQIDENKDALKGLGLKSATYIKGDGCLLKDDLGLFDCALTCPPYYNLESYSDLPEDISNLGSYWEFNAAMAFCAQAHYPLMKPGAFVCFVVGNFRDKNGELIDFRSHTVENFREAGFVFHQEIILSKNFGSAAKRSTNSWKGLKLVPIHEFLLVFRKPEKLR